MKLSQEVLVLNSLSFQFSVHYLSKRILNYCSTYAVTRILVWGWAYIVFFVVIIIYTVIIYFVIIIHTCCCNYDLFRNKS